MEEIAEDEEVTVTSDRESFVTSRERTCATAAESLVIGRMNVRYRRVKTCVISAERRDIGNVSVRSERRQRSKPRQWKQNNAGRGNKRPIGREVRWAREEQGGGVGNDGRSGARIIIEGGRGDWRDERSVLV